MTRELKLQKKKYPEYASAYRGTRLGLRYKKMPTVDASKRQNKN
ncbi:hypothetical protein CLOSTMETH_01826 [[Clostridium] methylpentosum DSM 5476]|uniref:Uncharacterized protein n=1 Tax=[Clostridium] methylpentosum DSM 5476 TaxID=537013 RepID=C0ED99_9FIRM|nr:hypothetical protein CLOSTMETH_01826 [[Clostridium] methylpentosum DSM 5476]